MEASGVTRDTNMNTIFADNGRMVNKLSIMATTLRGVNPTMSMQVFHTLLLVAQNPGSSVTDLSKASGFPLATMSRNLLDLGPRNRKREPGLGLVQATIDDMELRKKQVNLSPKGELLIKQLIDILKV